MPIIIYVRYLCTETYYQQVGTIYLYIGNQLCLRDYECTLGM